MVVALADGSIVQADQQTNYPLFWALRGGTGNNFGVVLEVTYRLQNLWKVWGSEFAGTSSWRPLALAAMQRRFTGGATPAKLGYQCVMEWVDVDGSMERQPVLQMRGIYDGSEADGRKALSAILTTKGAVLEISRIGTYEFLNKFLLIENTEAARLPVQVREEVDFRYVCKPLKKGAVAEDHRSIQEFSQRRQPDRS